MRLYGKYEEIGHNKVESNLLTDYDVYRQNIAPASRARNELQSSILTQFIRERKVAARREVVPRAHPAAWTRSVHTATACFHDYTSPSYHRPNAILVGS